MHCNMILAAHRSPRAALDLRSQIERPARYGLSEIPCILFVQRYFFVLR